VFLHDSKKLHKVSGSIALSVIAWRGSGTAAGELVAEDVARDFVVRPQTFGSLLA